MHQTDLGYVYSFGETWGSAPCHVCGEHEYLTVLSEDEYARVKGMTGSDACSFIVREKLGKAICPDHAGRPVEKPFPSGDATASDLCAMART